MQVLSDELKRNIRESLVYAVASRTPSHMVTIVFQPTSRQRNIITDFYHSLNRKSLLLNNEVDEEIENALKHLQNLIRQGAT